MTRKILFNTLADYIENSGIETVNDLNATEVVEALRHEVEKIDKENERRRAVTSEKKERDAYYDIILDILSDGNEYTSAQIVEKINDPEMTVQKINGRMNKLCADGDVVATPVIATEGRRRLVNTYRLADKVSE